jgi:hypothetical protein
MPEYVAKLPVPVEVGQTGCEPVAGSLLLAPYMPFRDGPETLLELLNAAARLIPFQRHDDALVLLSRSDIEWVRAGRGVDPVRVRPPHYRVTRRERARVRMRTGGEHEGLIQLELPDDLNRASDYLNGPEDFFPLVTPRGVLLVNKLQVADVRLFESSPLPLNVGGGDLDG